MSEQRGEAERRAVRPRGAKLWRVLVVGGMALAAACAGTQKGGSAANGNTGQPGGSSGAGGGGGMGGGTGGW